MDMWALGAIVHEMLTLQIPFLDTYIDDDLELTSTADVTVDTGLLYGYCHGVNPFPCDSLHSHRVSEEEIEFLKSLMVVNPSERLSAAAALSSAWLIRNTSIALPAFSTTGHPAAQDPPSSPETVATSDGEGNKAEMGSVAEDDHEPLLASGVLHPIDGSNEIDIISDHPPPARAVIPPPGSVDDMMNKLTKPAGESHRIPSPSAPQGRSGTDSSRVLLSAPTIHTTVRRGRSVATTEQSEQNSSAATRDASTEVTHSRTVRHRRSNDTAEGRVVASARRELMVPPAIVTYAPLTWSKVFESWGWK